MKKVRILRPPKHHLSTFGSTTLRYILLSPLAEPPAQCRLREGEVTAERPKILTPEALSSRFQGFGEEAETLQGHFDAQYGEAFRALEYGFRNTLSTTTLEHASLRDVADRTRKVLDAEAVPRTALLEGPDQPWGISVMKFIVETTLRSFPGNVRELDERGLFNPEGRRAHQERREVERLFSLAPGHPAAMKKLGEFLKATGLFADYEDRFFALIKN